MQVQTPVAVGELIDKITILEIKSEQITDPAKLVNIRKELDLLRSVRQSAVPQTTELTDLTNALKQVNQRIWDIEDAIRDLERDKSFGEEFIAVARSVYRTNDERAKIKRQINEAVGSELTEEKSYAAY